MQSKVTAALAVALLICLAPATALALTAYSTDFEDYTLPSEGGLLGDGWVVYGNVYTPTGDWIYGYGTFAAPNNSAVSAFCAVVLGEGGDDQGLLQLSVYNDYENINHASGNLVEANVFQEQTITADDVGDTWTFYVDAKLGNLTGASTAAAFIKTVDPSSNWDTTNYITQDLTATPVTWTGYTLSITIDAGLVDQLLQFGFTNTATLYESSGIYYDNVDFYLDDTTDVPTTAAFGAALGQNYPNPFNPATRIDFKMERAGSADIAVFDVAGRRIATLRSGVVEAGDHHVTWDGRTDAGAPAAAGQYRYVLTTAEGRISRSMVLVK